MFVWNWFLRATSIHSLYLLGAGASYPEIGLGNVLSDTVRKRFWDNGIFPASVQPKSPLKSAILRPNSAIQQQDCLISQEELDAHTPPEIVEVLVAQCLTRKEQIFPTQYRVFDLFYPSVIYNFNNDNLAYRVRPKHEVTYPHGKINPVIAHSSYMHEALSWLAIPQSVAKYFNYQRPIPEHPLITSMSPFRRLKDIFSTVHCVCFIGYSFGMWGGGMDDVESFELLTDLLRWKPKPVLIVNPAPQYLVELLETAIKRKSVYGLCCKWNILAKFILMGLFQRVYRISGGSDKLITNAYLWFDEFVEIVEKEKAIADEHEFPLVFRCSSRITGSISLKHLMKMCDCTKEFILSRLVTLDRMLHSV
jgi:hypothetical protein